jgi:hypothetical protein
MLDIKILQAEIYQEGDCRAGGQCVREEEKPTRGREDISTSSKTTRKTRVSSPTLIKICNTGQFK